MQANFTERWKPVVGFEGIYKVSSLGRIRRIGIAPGAQAGKIRKNQTNKGYPMVVLYANGRHRSVFIHTLVLESFVGPKPAGHECCHNDGDPSNCALANLRWGTPLDNAKDREKHGTHFRGEENNSAKLSPKEVAEIREMATAGGFSQREIAASFGINQSTVSRLVRRKRWPHLS